MSEAPFKQSSPREGHVKLLLDTLEASQPISRKELAALTGLSGATVTRFVNRLTALRLVEETGPITTAGPGRRAVNLRMVPGGLYALGCHIDVSGMRMCLIDLNRVCRSAVTVSLGREDFTPDRLAAKAVGLAADLTSRTGCQPASCGVTLSARMEQGVAIRSTVFRWENVHLQSAFENALHMPVAAENDVKSCLSWEAVSRGLRYTRRDAVYLYLGHRGIGLSSTVDGALMRGQSNAAGEIEHVSLGPWGDMSDQLMGISLVRRARLMAPAVQGIDDIIAAHRMGLKWASLLLDDFMTHLNDVLHLIRAFFDPHCVILGGELPEALGAAGLLNDGSEYILGHRFEEGCALGAAGIALDGTLMRMMNDSPDLTAP